MFQYIIKRILYFVPTLFIISLLTFILSKMAPGDPVELRLAGGMQSQSGGQLSEKLAGEKAYLELSEKMGLNLPGFYFSVSSRAYPDTLYKIARKYERETLHGLVNAYGNWPQISAYYHQAKAVEYSLFNIEQDSTNYDRVRKVRENCNELYRTFEEDRMTKLVKEIDSVVNMTSKVMVDSQWVELNTMSPIKGEADKLVAAYTSMKDEPTHIEKYIPTLHWYGTHNQYHRWLFGDVPWFGENNDPSKSAFGFFRFDFGKSYLDGRPVSSIILDAIKWTIIINFVSVFLAYIISIPVGVYTAVHKDSLLDRFSTAMMFVLFSLPGFWIATMLIVFITTPEYGMDWFPTYGTGSTNLPGDASFFTIFWDSTYHLILPVFCMTYGSFAYISRQMRGGMLSTIRQDFIRTAKAKGLDNNTIIWKHAFRNSLIPIITMFAGLFPLMLSGSVIIEYIFNIPGMGQVSYASVVARNYPVLYTVLMFAAILTMVGTLVADLLYAVVDPRISYTKKS